MKILRIIKSVNPSLGGPVEALRQLAGIHAEEGHATDILCLDCPSSPWLKGFGMPCIALGPSYGVFGYTFRLMPWLRAHVSNYDCVIVEGLWQYHGLCVWRVLKGSRVPYMVFAHGMLAPWFKRTYPLKHLKKWLYWPWADYRVLRDAAAVLFTCDQERLLARQSFWLYRANEVVVNFGTIGVPHPSRDYASSFLARRFQLKHLRRFLFLGRLHPVKGVDIIIETIARLQRSGKWHSKTMQLLVAGPDSGAYSEELKALAVRLGVDQSIVWIGMISGDEKWGALQCAEALVLPSHQENFGVVVAESLSVGVPVLISKAVNIWSDVVSDGAGTADDDSVDGFERQMIVWLRQSPIEVAVMREKARQCFERRYTAKRAADSLLSAAYEVVAARQSAMRDQSSEVPST